MTPEKMPLASGHDFAHVLQRVLQRHHGERSMLFNALTDVVG